MFFRSELAAVSTATTSSLNTCSACSDKVTLSAGDAKSVNATTHVLDPWPPGVNDRRIPASGDRMVRAIERYRRGPAQAVPANSGPAGPPAAAGQEPERPEPCPARRREQTRAKRPLRWAASRPQIGNGRMRVIVSGLQQVRRHLGDYFRKWRSVFVTGATAKRGFLPLSLGGCLVMLVSGCGSLSERFVLGAEAVPTTATVEEPADIKYYPSDEPLRMGMEYFGRGNYGLAERYFRDAVEKAPRDATAWTGLAASYDRLRRFDLADRSYAQAIKLTGETIQLLNNQGYSFMMRGNYVRARQKLQRAYELDPANPVVINDLALLNESRRFVQRTPEQL